MPSARTGIPLQRGVYGKVVRDSDFSLKFMAEGTGDVTSGNIFNSVLKHLCANLFTSVKKRDKKKKKKKKGNISEKRSCVNLK